MLTFKVLERLWLQKEERSQLLPLNQVPGRSERRENLALVDLEAESTERAVQVRLGLLGRVGDESNPEVAALPQP